MNMMQEHSPLGGSGAYRWIPCPGSVRVSAGVEDPESEYAALGTAAHALAAYCLSANFDAWENLGTTIAGGTHFYPPGTLEPGIEGVVVDKDMADAVQQYFDAVRIAYPERHQGNTWVERAFHCPSIHELMWGQADFVYLPDTVDVTWTETEYAGLKKRLHVRDYKHGAGIVVDVVRNPQLMYYGVGMLEDLQLWDEVDEVVLWVDQPRGWMDSPRSWTTTPAELARWRDDVLVPAMDLADRVSRDAFLTDEDLLRLNLLNSDAEWCRFCPARYRNCPRHVADMEEMEEIMEKIEAAGGAPKATNEEVGRFLTLFEIAKVRQKALREVGFARAQEGHEVPGWKLARARSNREWKEDVEPKIKRRFKKDAMEPAKLKSPANIDALPGGKAFTAEHAYKPDVGLQLVPDSDARAEAGPKGRAMFQPVAEKPKRKRSK